MGAEPLTRGPSWRDSAPDAIMLPQRGTARVPLLRRPVLPVRGARSPVSCGSSAPEPIVVWPARGPASAADGCWRRFAARSRPHVNLAIRRPAAGCPASASRGGAQRRGGLYAARPVPPRFRCWPVSPWLLNGLVLNRPSARLATLRRPRAARLEASVNARVQWPDYRLRSAFWCPPAVTSQLVVAFRLRFISRVSVLIFFGLPFAAVSLPPPPSRGWRCSTARGIAARRSVRRLPRRCALHVSGRRRLPGRRRFRFRPVRITPVPRPPAGDRPASP